MQSSKAFTEQSFKKAHPYQYKSSYLNQYSPYMKHEMREHSNSHKGTEQRKTENWLEAHQKEQQSPLNFCNSKKPPMLPSARSSFKKSKRKNSLAKMAAGNANNANGDKSNGAGAG